jgi:hypothetical protein
VSFEDFAPTYLEAAGVQIPEVMTGKSFLGALKATGSGTMLPGRRQFVVSAVERHPSVLYPIRAIRDGRFLYIRNMIPQLNAAGDENVLKPDGKPNYEDWFRRCDDGRAKRFLIDNRADAAIKPYYESCFMKRPSEEMFDCIEDPYNLTNLAEDSRYADDKKRLACLLGDFANRTADPRSTELRVDCSGVSAVAEQRLPARHPLAISVDRTRRNFILVPEDASAAVSGSVVITDSRGQTKATFSLTGKSIRVDFRSWARGAYTVRAQWQNQDWAQQIFVY